MPNYRQKNKKNKNKNRQKNQQQQNQQQQQPNNKSKTQHANQQEEEQTQQPEQQSTQQNRHLNAGTKHNNQSQGRPLRPDQSTTNQQQQAPKSAKSPIIATSTALDSKDAPSPRAHTSSEEDAARNVATTGPAVITEIAATDNATNIKCDNLNSNVAPTTNHQQVNAPTTVQNEECNRIEDANVNAHQTKLANKAEAASNKTARGGVESEVISDALPSKAECTMGNKESKTFNTSSDAGDANAETIAGGTISEDQRIAGESGELKEAQAGVSKAQMAKVIVHRIVPVDTSECMEDKAQESDRVSKEARVKIASDKNGKEVVEGTEARRSEEQKTLATSTANVEQNKKKVKQEQKQKQKGKKGGAQVVENAQRSKVIVHKFAQEDREAVIPEQLVKEAEVNAAYETSAQQQQIVKVTDQNAQISEGAKVNVHKNAQDVSASQVPTEACALTKNEEHLTFNSTQQASAEPKVIIHHIQLESTSPPTHYEVELPETDSPTSPVNKWSKQTILNKNIVHIQELSDESSSEYNDNPPLISEAESETESTAGACSLDYAQQIRTLSPDSEDSYELVGGAPSPTHEQQDPKHRRAQKRVALESHFLPQLLSPRYLDSIVEENSDMSDTRSDCSENPLAHTHSSDSLHDATAAKVRKANEIFPRSNLDFSRRHTKKPLGALPKKPTACIREEPVAMVVAAKLIDDASAQAQECCTRLSSEHTPESEAAEVIYLSSSASSSLSDLLELDAVAEEGDAEDEHDSGHSIIDLDTDVHEIITKPSGGGVQQEETRALDTAALPTNSDSRESTPVNQVSPTAATATSRLSENENETQKIFANNHNNSSVRGGEAQRNTANEEAPIGTNIDAVTAENNNVIGAHQHFENRIYENLESLQFLDRTISDERALRSSGAPAVKATTTKSPAATATASNASESETETELSSETTTTTTERCEYLRSSDSDGNQSSGSSSIISSIESKYPPPDTLTTSDSLNVDPAVLLENIELEMNNVREILNSHITDDASSTAAVSAISTYGNVNNIGNDARTSELKLFANYHNSSAAKQASTPSPPPIPPPPSSVSASDFHSDFIGATTKTQKTPSQAQTQSLSQIESSYAPPPPIPTRSALHETHHFTTNTTEQTSPQTTSASSSFSSIKSALNSLSKLGRQESSESHCSDSTQHSYCTAINVGSYAQNDDLTSPLTANSPISDNPQYNSWKYTSAPAEGSKTPTNLTHTHDAALEEHARDEQKDPSIKKLRLLCTEQLASMPYGEEVLVELATVAQNIGELQAKTPTAQDKYNAPQQQTSVDGAMPYPLPQLPHISELQLSIAKDAPTQISSTTQRSGPHTYGAGEPVHIARDFTKTAPPVPTPHAHYSNGASEAPWLGVPTSADPNVLVCLSPAQQQQLSSGVSATHPQPHSHPQPPADQLLDAHTKFLDRRGYHEFSEEQVKSLNTEMQKEEEQILKMAAYMKKLRKSLTPPPPPIPPPPVPSKSSETAAKARTASSAAAAAISSIGSSAVESHSQRAYDTTATKKYRIEQQRTVTFANGEQEQEQEKSQQKQQQHSHEQSQQNHLLITHNTGKPADFVADSNVDSIAGASSYQPTSSLENNSRQLSGAAGGARGSALDFAGKQTANSAETRQYTKASASEATNAQSYQNLYGANNKQESSNSQSSFPSTSAAARMQGVESELAKMFPSMGSSNIFDSERKRFSNIESSTSATGAPYCVQLQSTLPKRYSNIETHSWEAKKRMENGEVVYDYSDASHERKSDGDKSLQSASTPTLLTHFPVKEAAKVTQNQYPVAGDGISQRSGNSEIMSAIKLNTTTDTDAQSNVVETKEKENEKANGINMTNFHYSGVPNHNHTSSATTNDNSATSSSSHFSDHKFSKTTTEESTTIREENISKNSQAIGGGAVRPTSSGGAGDANVSGSNSAFEEFRQHANKTDTSNARGVYAERETPATAPPLGGGGDSKHSAFNFQHDKLFKDFDTLTQQLHNELAEGKAQREQREKSASLYDLSRMQWNSKDHFEQLKKERHEHMKELEREIERSARSRQTKGWNNGTNGLGEPSAGRTFDIPIRIEQRADEHVNSHAHAHANGDRSLAQPRAYNIPIQLENGAAPAVPTRPSHSYDTVDDAARFRRAESMFNLSENARRPQPQAQRPNAAYERPQSTAVDDWARYASDFGSSENIARPFAREVEICYQRQRPRTIRAPRLSASTNDLSSSTQSYDTYNAYNVRRTHAPMMQPVSQQQQRPHHASCYSVLERDPNPTYISTTTRRGVSPAPAVHATTQEPPYSPVLAPERQRRASLPREIQEQQLKYISSKEEELRMEFERLQNERRRLMEEISTTPTTLQMPQHPMRDIYRPVPKLPTLTEDEVFRQQMAEEWLNKVAEREERRLQKIIKISKLNEGQLGQHGSTAAHLKPDISDEFLKRVHERRTKLAMPADSDWESGAESQPAAPGHASESDAEAVPVKVIEGKAETDLRHLPRHLREFARFSNHNEEKIDGGHRVVHQEEERRQEANANSMSSALKKSSMVKTVKIARHPEIVGEPSHRVPASVQQRQQQQQQQQQQGYRRMSSGGEQVFADETAPFSTELPTTPPPLQPHSPLFSNKLPVTPSFEEMFATSPFRSRILDEFDRFWRSFDHTT